MILHISLDSVSKQKTSSVVRRQEGCLYDQSPAILLDGAGYSQVDGLYIPVENGCDHSHYGEISGEQYWKGYINRDNTVNEPRIMYWDHSSYPSIKGWGVMEGSHHRYHDGANTDSPTSLVLTEWMTRTGYATDPVPTITCIAEYDLPAGSDCTNTQLCASGLVYLSDNSCGVETASLDLAKERGCPSSSVTSNFQPVPASVANVRCCHDTLPCMSNDNNNQCHADVDRDTGGDTCKDTMLYPAGNRLCTSLELASGACCGTECYFNTKPTWILERSHPAPEVAYNGCLTQGQSTPVSDTVSYAAVRCCSLDGLSCKSKIGANNRCPEGVRKADALATCTDAGLRLCTVEELHINNICCSSGCNFDSKFVGTQ
ncbi:hypothetical protein SARC_07623 [Sphaeroforma arctica JP610]|uniref:Uncharacterized protein n=1 Tax=Sphaeroforma arctica JP610 TaxID=667725 RepID=A0A0L0FVP0_9EUKA|nr:hypothetical protein SARC_07623 [Sphaeroforma arctica JP610]KNC80008.1 hypothetical protein SARC_07623 [Sphaeroforma arctica JP610]|eukprot:XP_014153910.1 hypothetical protein SARC_07623 [Sphaeroforma arctica JP610]